MAHQQVLTGTEVDNMQRERPTKTRIFRAEITKFETPINTQQQVIYMSPQVELYPCYKILKSIKHVVQMVSSHVYLKKLL